MQILVIADRPARRSIKEIIAEQPVDMIVTLGDVTGGDIVELQDITSVPKLGVYGNHDSGNYMQSLGIENMHLQTREFGGLVFGGFQGCVRYKQNPDAIMYTQEEASSLLKDFPRVDVMLTHCPPFGVNDDQTEISHTGFIALRDYITRQHPRYLLHGHTYPAESELVTQFEDTAIRYVYQDKVIDLV